MHPEILHKRRVSEEILKRYASQKDFSGLDLYDATNFTRIRDLRGADFSYANLRGANFRGASKAGTARFRLNN